MWEREMERLLGFYFVDINKRLVFILCSIYVDYIKKYEEGDEKIFPKIWQVKKRRGGSQERQRTTLENKGFKKKTDKKKNEKRKAQ